MFFLCDPDDNNNGDDDDVDNGDDVIVHTTHAVSDTAYHDTVNLPCFVCFFLFFFLLLCFLYFCPVHLNTIKNNQNNVHCIVHHFV